MQVFFKLNLKLTLIYFLCIIQINRINTQIRFPDEEDTPSSVRPNANTNELRPVDNYNSNHNFNTNWYQKTNCMSYRGIPGYCIPFYQCNELKYSRDFYVLRKSLCGFYYNEPKVCCPAQTYNPSNGYPNNNGNSGYPNNNNGRPNNNGNSGYPNNNGNSGYPNNNGNSGYPNNNGNSGYPNNNGNSGYPNNNGNSGYPNNNGNNGRPNNNNDNSDDENSNSLEGDAGLDFNYPRKLPQNCGVSTKEATRVVGGSPALPGAWPWMVSLQYGKPNSRSHLCGGALVSSNLVVTATHCLKNDDGSVTSPRMLSVRLGEHNIEKDTPDDAAQEFDIAEVTVHPNYTKTFKNDIAVLKLKKNVVFNDRISPICLPYNSELIRAKSLTGRGVMITGWGLTSYNGQSSPTLLQATLKVVNENFCKKAFSKWLTITEEYLCATSEGFDKDSCQGDSGGPLTMFEPTKKRWYLVGVVSFGKKCASPDTPGVYARVSQYLNWFKNFI